MENELKLNFKRLFKKKTAKTIHYTIVFNNIPGSKADSRKHFSVCLDLNLPSDIHIKTILTKVN